MAVQLQSDAAVSADLVYTDDLTSLRNRRFLYRVFGEGWKEIVAPDSELSLAIVDLDYFKQVNDTHGHLTGDLVLAETAALIRGFLSEQDHAVRYGGDEFVLLLPRRSKSESRDLAENLRLAMADKEFVSKEEGQRLEVVLSFSIGVATYPEDGASGEELMAAADRALYASKQAGRNCVTASGEEPADLADEIDRFRTFPSKSLVGRQEFMDHLASLCELTNMGTGTWTALEGPPGVGKTRLLHEALRLGLDSGISCVLVDLAKDQASMPYSGLARILTEIGARYTSAFDSILVEADPALISLLATQAPDLVADHAEPNEAGSRSPGQIQDALASAIGRLCTDRRWLFLLDDVAFLDGHSAQVLRQVIESERLPIGIVSAQRSADSESEHQPGTAFLQALEWRPWYDRRVVSPLSREAVDVLVSVLLPNYHAPAEYKSLLFDVTEGNPLFVEEVLRLGIARRTITYRGGEWFVQMVDRESLPITLEEAIEQRMAVLDSELGEGISRASALGTSLSSDVLQALLGKNEGEILDFLDKARAQGLVEGGQYGDLSKLRFATASYRDQAYELMSAADRTRTHREIGKIEERRAGSLVGALASRLAYHFERGEVYEKARAYFEAARSSAPPLVVAGSWHQTEVPKHRRQRITGAAVPLPEEAWPSLDNALRSLAQATKSLWMYPEGSPIADSAIRDFHRHLGPLFENTEIISLAAVEDTLVVNGIPYPARRQKILARGLLEQFEARELRGLTIRKGLSEGEAIFLVSQLASDEPVERDPEAWEVLLAERGIENVDFADRVYVPAEGVAGGSMVGESGRSPSGVIRIASAEDLDSETPEVSERHKVEGAATAALSADEVRSLLGRLEADAAIDAEIETLVPLVVELLKKILDAADAETRRDHLELVEAVRVTHSESLPDAISGQGEYLRRIRAERSPEVKQRLLEPAEEKFTGFVEARDFKSARTVLRFIRQCQVFEGGNSDLAEEAHEAMASLANGSNMQLLLADLLETAEAPDESVLDLLRELGADGGATLVTFLRETDDLRARRLVAGLIKDIGGEPYNVALASTAHGENPVVARRVIGVLDRLSRDLAIDLSRVVTVRNPGVLGEVIKVIQAQPRTIQARVLGKLLESASPELVCRGIYYLSEWQLVEAKGKILALLGESEDHEILAAVTAAVARWRLPEAVPILGELLGRKQVMRLVPAMPRGLRREFARALAAIGNPEAKDVLAEFTRDVDPEVRNIARGMPTPAGA